MILFSLKGVYLFLMILKSETMVWVSEHLYCFLLCAIFQQKTTRKNVNNFSISTAVILTKYINNLWQANNGTSAGNLQDMNKWIRSGFFNQCNVWLTLKDDTETLAGKEHYSTMLLCHRCKVWHKGHLI